MYDYKPDDPEECHEIIDGLRDQVERLQAAVSHARSIALDVNALEGTFRVPESTIREWESLSKEWVGIAISTMPSVLSRGGEG